MMSNGRLFHNLGAAIKETLSPLSFRLDFGTSSSADQLTGGTGQEVSINYYYVRLIIDIERVILQMTLDIYIKTTHKYMHKKS